MSTTTFGTINNVQFVTNRNNLVNNSLENGGNLSKSRNFQNHFCSVNCENQSQDNSNRNKFVANGKAGAISPCTPNGLSCCNSFATKGTVVSPSMSSCSTNSRFSSSSSNSSSFKGSDSMSSGLAVEELPTGTIRFATDRPHLVSMGGGRLSTSVTLHPINEGKTVLGSGGMGVVPDIPVLGTGVEPEHCQLENKDGSVYLTPLAPMVAIDGLKITSKTKLTQGCMICLGRSHYFRFNHPSEAKLMRAILPNARISMAPITFYPAVDNPEYFHMTAQEAAGLGEEIRVHNDESPPPSQREEERGSSHPPVPPRKNPPPSTLTFPLSENAAVDSQNNKQSCQMSSPSESGPKSSSEEYSDSESPPEVPPRSEGTCPTYVNTTAATLLSPNPKSSATYLGEYIYTKAEEELSTTTNSLKTKEALSSQFTLSPTSVITHNGMTMAHNAMYRSIPASLSSQEILQSRSPIGSPTSCSSQLTFFNAASQHTIVSQPSSMVTSASHCSVSPFMSNNSVGQYSSPRTPLPVAFECSPKTCSTLGGSITSPSYNSSLNSRYANLGSPVGTLEKDLKLSEKKKQLAHEERMQEQAMASAEKARLEEILKMCAEYERQQNVGAPSIGSPTSSADTTSTSKSSISPYHTLTQNRIKTNGSLPREKRSPLSSPPPSHMGITSPTGTVPPLSSPLSSSRRTGTPSEDELNSIFSFESDSGFNISNGASATNRSDFSCPYPPFPNLSSGLEGTPSPPPISPRSPYENISHTQHLGYPMPQSPRTRIRTIVGKDRRDHCEVLENKMAFVDAHSPQSYNSSCSFTSSGVSKTVSRCTPKENGLSERVPVKPPRSPRINRKVLIDDDDLTKTKDFNIIDNKYFADVTPAKTKASQPNFKNSNFKHFNDEKNEKISAAKRNCLTAFTSESNSSLSRSKVFEEHMIRNIQDTLNINDIASEVEKLKKEKDEALKETVRLKGKISDLESQENEALRELELERALLDGELDCLKYSLEADEEALSQLLKKSSEMEKRHKDDRAKDKETINNCKMRLELAEKELDNVGKNELSLSEKELKEKNELEKQKHDTVETERKIFEDTEFSQMESEALRESEREELNKEICDLKEKIISQKEKAAELEKQMVDITSSVRSEADCLETERQKLISEVNKSTGNDLVDRLAQLHLLDQSQEDLDRINQIATLSPLEYREGTLGRKTSAAFMEVERNRQLNLVKQGTQVINDEKKRVEELKRKVAHKVKAEWEERRKVKAEREVACASLDSIGSDESSSLTSSDIHAESLSSDDVIAHRNSGGENTAKETNKVRQRDSETPPDFGEQSRPLSDASSSYDADVQPPVRYREKGKTQQRPLTRYLPVRSEEHFDLRQHIESAGHQIELCPYLSLNHMSCRGYLHKLGSKFRTWQKRWFVFDRSKRAFLYYSDKSESKPRGGTYFQAIEDVYVDHHSVKSPSPKLAFCVKTHDRTYHLMAPSPEAMRIWIDVIFTGAEGYQEFQGGT